MSSRRSRTAHAAVVVGFVAVAAAGVGTPAHSAAATCAGVAATIVGTTGDDVLTGTPGDDVIAALDGNDVIDGGAGNDVVCADAGSDHLTGGDGNDRLYGGDNGLVPRTEDVPEAYGDTLVPGPGDDLVDVGVNTLLRTGGDTSWDTIDFGESETGVAVDLVSGVATGEGNDTVVVAQPLPAPGVIVYVIGTTHADHVLGTEGSDVIIGNGGGDRLEGRSGDDSLTNSRDAYEYDPARNGTDDDHFDGGAGDDHLESNGGADVLLGGDGRDYLRKVAGVSTLDAGAGRDEVHVYLTEGRHRLSGGAGRDTVFLNLHRAGRSVRGVMDHARERFVVRRAQRPPVRARVVGVERVQMPYDSGRWTYLGTPGDDHVEGMSAYTAKGRGGGDVLLGSYLDDVLLGGPGRDRIRGRRGADRCSGEDLRGCEVVRRAS
ncbi:calcium-binding protein [Nocardioides glacieisoli]|nr:calcium-binding protein [Nocardioides glacieisoli]